MDSTEYAECRDRIRSDLCSELAGYLESIAATMVAASPSGPYESGVAAGRRQGIIDAARWLYAYRGVPADVPTIAEEMAQHH